MAASGPKLIIDYQNERRTYDYWREYDKQPARLRLQDKNITNVENSNELYRYLSQFRVYLRLKNGKYKFSINFDRPENEKTNLFDDEPYRLKNEEELCNYLLGLSFPFEIDEVYKKICEITVDSVDKYSKFELYVEKEIDEKNSKTTDMIVLKHGQLQRITKTKDGKTITLDNNGNWSYDSSSLVVSQSPEGEISYSINSVPSEELIELNPYKQYTEATKEVESVRKLTRTMLQSNK